MVRKNHEIDNYTRSKSGTYTVEDNLMVARLLACTFQVEFVYHALLKENKCDCVVSYSVKTDGCSKHQHHKKMPLNLYSYREYPQILTYGRKKKKTDKYTTQHCNFAMIQTNTMQNCGLSFGAIKKSLPDEILWRISTYVGPYSVRDFILLCTMVDIDVEIDPCNALAELLLKDDRMNQRKLYEEKKDLLIYNSKKYMLQFKGQRCFTEEFTGVATMGDPRNDGTSTLCWETTGAVRNIKWTNILLVKERSLLLYQDAENMKEF